MTDGHINLYLNLLQIGFDVIKLILLIFLIKLVMKMTKELNRRV